jgi:hypothetical protein
MGGRLGARPDPGSGPVLEYKLRQMHEIGEW